MSPLNSTTMASANSEEKTSASRMNNNMSTSGMPPGGRLKFFKGMVFTKDTKFSSVLCVCYRYAFLTNLNVSKRLRDLCFGPLNYRV